MVSYVASLVGSLQLLLREVVDALSCYGLGPLSVIVQARAGVVLLVLRCAKAISIASMHVNSFTSLFGSPRSVPESLAGGV